MDWRPLFVAMLFAYAAAMLFGSEKMVRTAYAMAGAGTLLLVMLLFVAILS